MPSGIGLECPERILVRFTDQRLRRQVKDDIWICAIDHAPDRVEVAEVNAMVALVFK